MILADSFVQFSRLARILGFWFCSDVLGFTLIDDPSRFFCTISRLARESVTEANNVLILGCVHNSLRVSLIIQVKSSLIILSEIIHNSEN
jgi:hypothetical protein